MSDSAPPPSYRFLLAALLFLSSAFFRPALSLAQTAESYRQQALELASRKSWDDAIAAYHRSLELAPNDPVTHYQLALVLQSKGDSKQAVEEFQAALRLKPKWPDAHYALGATFFDLQDQPSALNELRATIAIDPANVPAHRLLARIDMQQNDPATARKELQRALQSKPSPNYISNSVWSKANSATSLPPPPNFAPPSA